MLKTFRFQTHLCHSNEKRYKDCTSLVGETHNKQIWKSFVSVPCAMLPVQCIALLMNAHVMWYGRLAIALGWAFFENVWNDFLLGIHVFDVVWSAEPVCFFLYLVVVVVVVRSAFRLWNPKYGLKNAVDVWCSEFSCHHPSTHYTYSFVRWFVHSLTLLSVNFVSLSLFLVRSLSIVSNFPFLMPFHCVHFPCCAVPSVSMPNTQKNIFRIFSPFRTQRDNGRLLPFLPHSTKIHTHTHTHILLPLLLHFLHHHHVGASFFQ